MKNKLFSSLNNSFFMCICLFRCSKPFRYTNYYNMTNKKIEFIQYNGKLKRKKDISCYKNR